MGNLSLDTILLIRDFFNSCGVASIFLFLVFLVIFSEDVKKTQTKAANYVLVASGIFFLIFIFSPSDKTFKTIENQKMHSEKSIKK